MLRDPADDRSPASDNDRVVIFYAAAELNVRYLFLDRPKIKVLMISIQGRASPTRHTPGIDEVFSQNRG